MKIVERHWYKMLYCGDLYYWQAWAKDSNGTWGAIKWCLNERINRMEPTFAGEDSIAQSEFLPLTEEEVVQMFPDEMGNEIHIGDIKNRRMFTK